MHCSRHQLRVCTEKNASTSLPTRKIILQTQGKWWCVPWAASNHCHVWRRIQTPASLKRHGKVEKLPWPEISIALEHPQKYVIGWQRRKILLGTICILKVVDGGEQLWFPRTSDTFLGGMTSLLQRISYFVVSLPSCPDNTHVLYPLVISWLSRRLWAALLDQGSLFLACTVLILTEPWSFIRESQYEYLQFTGQYLTGRENTTGRPGTFSLPHFHQLVIVLSSFIMLNNFSSLFKYLDVRMLLLINHPLGKLGFAFVMFFCIVAPAS